MSPRLAALTALAAVIVTASACGSSSPSTGPTTAVPTAVKPPSSGSSATLPPNASADASTSGSSATAAAATPLDPCSLLNAEDAKTLDLGYPGRRNHELTFGPSCVFAGMIVTLFDAGTTESAFRFGATRPIPNLGDEAFYGAVYHFVRVKKAATRFEVRCQVCHQATEEQTMIKVAQKVLTHVPS